MKPDETIYLDYAATTPVAPQVVTAMLPYLTTAYGNPSSTHAFGRTAKLAVEEARGSIASFLNVKPNEIIFTSGGSESNVLAIKGMLQKKGRGHLILSAVEHPSHWLRPNRRSRSRRRISRGQRSRCSHMGHPRQSSGNAKGFVAASSSSLEECAVSSSQPFATPSSGDQESSTTDRAAPISDF